MQATCVGLARIERERQSLYTHRSALSPRSFPVGKDQRTDGSPGCWTRRGSPCPASSSHLPPGPPGWLDYPRNPGLLFATHPAPFFRPSSFFLSDFLASFFLFRSLSLPLSLSLSLSLSFSFSLCIGSRAVRRKQDHTATERRRCFAFAAVRGMATVVRRWRRPLPSRRREIPRFPFDDGDRDGERQDERKVRRRPPRIEKSSRGKNSRVRAHALAPSSLARPTWADFLRLPRLRLPPADPFHGDRPMIRRRFAGGWERRRRRRRTRGTRGAGELADVGRRRVRNGEWITRWRL